MQSRRHGEGESRGGAGRWTPARSAENACAVGHHRSGAHVRAQNEPACEKTLAFPHSAVGQPSIVPREWQLMLCPSGGFVQTPELQKPQRGCPGLSVSCRGPLTVGIVGSGPFCVSHNKQTSKRPFQGSMDISCKTISY